MPKAWSRLLSPWLLLSVATGTSALAGSAAADDHRILTIQIERAPEDDADEESGCDYALLDHKGRELRRLPISALPKSDKRMRLMMFWGLSSTEKYSVVTRCKGEKDIWLLEDMTVDQIGAH
jgi:hypothetical protein